MQSRIIPREVKITHIHHDSDGKLWSNERLLQQLNTYHAARHQISLVPEARNARHTHISEDGLTICQTLIDPDDLNDWSLHLTLDLEKIQRGENADSVFGIHRADLSIVRN